jgi:hypothetical protein
VIGSSAATQDSGIARTVRGGRYSFFRGHHAFLQRRHGGALTTQHETACRGGIQSHKNFTSSRVNRPSVSEDRAGCEPDFDCKDFNKYFLKSDQEEVPRHVGGSPRRGLSRKRRRQIQLLHLGRRLLRVWHPYHHLRTAQRPVRAVAASHVMTFDELALHEVHAGVVARHKS